MKIRALASALTLAAGLAVAAFPGAASAETELVRVTYGYHAYGYPAPPLCIDRFGYVVPPHFCAPRGYWLHGRHFYGPAPGYIVRYPHPPRYIAPPRVWHGHPGFGHGYRGHGGYGGHGGHFHRRH